VKSISFVILICFSFNSSAIDLTEIVGGVDTVRNELPFQASLRYEGIGHGCGGALIAPNWVLTAAHCVHGNEKEKMSVILGLLDRTKTKEGEKFAIEEIIEHPGYGTHDAEDDLALIKLNGNSKFAPVKMNASDLAYTSASPMLAWVSGWGATKQGDLDLPKILKKVQVPLVTNEDCNTPQSYNGKIKESQICAGYKEGGKDSCQCDSGGPLYLAFQDNQFLLVGIVNYGEGCARPDKYGVYAKVSYYYPWILQTISH
jgi:trypsin